MKKNLCAWCAIELDPGYSWCSTDCQEAWNKSLEENKKENNQVVEAEFEATPVPQEISTEKPDWIIRGGSCYFCDAPGRAPNMSCPHRK